MMGRRAMQTIADKDLEQYFKERGMEARFWRDKADHMLHVLAKPDIGQIRSLEYFTLSKIDTHLAPWYNIWWARLLRWIESKLTSTKFKRYWHLPYWVLQLIYAQHINVLYENRLLQKDILERIQIMRHYLLVKHIQPSKVLIGPKALDNLQRQHGYNSDDCLWAAGANLGYVNGLPIQLNPFLAEDAVIVC